MPADVGDISSASPDDQYHKKDKNYRRYASAVERALALFDTALQEWADYISFLGRLLKALQTKPTGINDIPHSDIVAKRLAQCLDPTLPSGVHQKTLELYAYVFSTLGKKGLSKELPLYLPGLSPLLSFASLSVKPSLLTLFENYIVLLEPTILRPALKAIVLALLPGLEEETGEDFERTHTLLNKVRNAVGPGSPSKELDAMGDRYFWQSLFLATITSPSRRQGALAYLTRNLPCFGTPVDKSSDPDQQTVDPSSKRIGELRPDIEAVISPEAGLLIRCFSAGLHDEQLLTQRGFMDLLVTHLPLHSPVLTQNVVSEDLELLISAASSVVARREMSLNRRLWVWLLGSDVTTNDNSIPNSPSSPSFGGRKGSQDAQRLSPFQYFEQYGLESLISSLRNMINNSSSVPSVRARPFRICLSLMDRWEIGGLVVPHIFLPAMESLRSYQNSAPSKEAFAEVLRSANVFFDGIQSGLIWSQLVQTTLNMIKAEPEHIQDQNAQAQLELVWFIVTTFNVREEEMLSLHLPVASVAMLILLQKLTDTDAVSDTKFFEPLVQIALRTTLYLLDLIPERVFKTIQPEADIIMDRRQDVLERIEDFYRAPRTSSQAAKAPTLAQVEYQIRRAASEILMHGLRRPDQSALYNLKLTVFDKVLAKLPGNYDITGILSCLSDTARLGVPFASLPALVSTWELMRTVVPTSQWTSDYRVREITTDLTKTAWEYVSPAQSKYSVEAVRCLWRIQSVFPHKHLVEGAITSLMLEDGRLTVESVRRFNTLWTHSTGGDSRRRLEKANNELELLEKPLLLVLDTLYEPKTDLSMFAVNWLQSLPSIKVVFDVLIHHLHQSPYAIHLLSTESARKQADVETTQSLPEIKPSLYFMQTISNLLNHCSGILEHVLAGRLGIADTYSDVTSNKKAVVDQSRKVSEDQEYVATTEYYLIRVCMAILGQCASQGLDCNSESSAIRATAVSLLSKLLPSASPAVLSEELENSLTKTLSWSIEWSDLPLQAPMMDLILIVLKLRSAKRESAQKPRRRATSRETISNLSQLSLSTEKSEKDPVPTEVHLHNPAVLDCIMLGLRSPKSQPLAEQWIRFLDNFLSHHADETFQILMPIVGCYCGSIESVFDSIRATFEDPLASLPSLCDPIHTLNLLLNGLEQVLGRGHDQLRREEATGASVKTPEQVQGFFGNMVSGVFTSEGQKTRATTANNRLTVLLCFKDAIRVSFKLWSWGDARSTSHDLAVNPSFNYTSIRLRNRTRRVLENLFAAESLECLESLVEFWHNVDASSDMIGSSTVLNLLHALEAARPKNTIPALFNAIYSRTNPTVLDPPRKSTLTSELSDVNLSVFLIAYTKSVDDDALDEIWTDCMTFLRDVLGNPLPHRQILPTLLEFIALLGQKSDNTNYGEQRKMRRDIGDLFVRLLAATFTVKPLVFAQDTQELPNSELALQNPRTSRIMVAGLNPDDVVSIVASVLPNITKILLDTDRMATATTTISTHILSPTLRARTYPFNITQSVLDILKVMSRIPECSKAWRKDVSEAFNDARFFAIDSQNFVEAGWMPVLRQWALSDKERVPELLSRLSAPASAGIVFGVGATSARLEADRKTQLNLRRTALLMLSADDDAFTINIGTIQDKLSDLINATVTTSPSSTTRAEVYMVLRALLLKNASIHLASLWPIINTELSDVLSSLEPSNGIDMYNISSILQAAKLLDLLSTIAPDDFQLREWLFITDTIDAVYRPAGWKPFALVDELAESLDKRAGTPQIATIQPAEVQIDHEKGFRRPLLRENEGATLSKAEMVDQVLRPFLRQLSIHSFESTYRMEVADLQACREDLLHDIFDDRTLV